MIAVLLAALVVPATASAQFYFGKNKVQYTAFDWQVMTTDHFRVYFYAEEEQLAQTAAKLAETSYDVLSEKFNHEIPEPVPFIIYSSPLYFSQTNVIPGLLPESVGGFTEFMKGRVVVPFNGSYADFDHVIRHELVHAFMLSRLDEIYDNRGRVRTVSPPLWFTEGLAEYWSKDWDAKADMVVGDMAVGGRMPSIDQMYRVRGTYFMYKLGESILHFIDSTYGSDKIARLFDNWHKGRDFDDIVRITTGDDLDEISGKWEYEIKKKYYPEMEDRGLPKMESRQITHDGFSEKGVLIQWPEGDSLRDYVVYKAYRMGYVGIYMKPVDDPDGSRRTLVKGERSSAFESLHLLRSGIDATDDGRVVFSSKSKESDVLYIYELSEDRVTRRFEFPDLVEARSPQFSPDGSQVVFSGVRKDGYTNIYLLDVADGSYRSLTDDMYLNSDPTFTPEGDAVVFSSDRTGQGPSGALNLYRIEIESGLIRQLTDGPHRDQTPECGPDGVYFSSDREGFFNLFRLDSGGHIHRLSSYAAGAFDPRLSSDGEWLVYTGYQDMGYQIYRMPVPVSAPAIAEVEEPGLTGWEPVRIGEKFSRSAVQYDTDYSLDIAQSSIGYDPVYGSIGGIQAAMTDMLGNRAIYLLLTNTARSKDDFLESFNVGATYINRENRVNWGLGGFHLYDEYYNDYDQYYFERQAGGLALVSYPFSKFQRVDFTTVARYSKRDSRFDFNEREAFLLTNYLSFVYDNSIWDITGPIEGRRYNFTLGLTNSLDRMRNFSRTAMADVRHYFRLGKNSAFANRLLAYTSAGREPQRIYLGGSWSFRGYQRRAFYNRNVLFASNELRFPLIDVLAIGFPFGGMDFRGIRGALFFDTGSAWDREFDQFLGSFGFGFRVALGYLVVLRFDFTRTTDFESVSPSTDFDFFFGWNF
jgi:hypothetical protein